MVMNTKRDRIGVVVAKQFLRCGRFDEGRCEDPVHAASAFKNSVSSFDLNLIQTTRSRAVHLLSEEEHNQPESTLLVRASLDFFSIEIGS